MSNQIGSDAWRIEVAKALVGKLIAGATFEPDSGGYYMLTFTDGSEICFDRTMAEVSHQKPLTNLAMTAFRAGLRYAAQNAQRRADQTASQGPDDTEMNVPELRAVTFGLGTLAADLAAEANLVNPLADTELRALLIEERNREAGGGVKDG